MRARLGYLFFLPLASALLGCGPGFPIMTAEQEALVKNVDALVRENPSIKTRLAALESGGGEAADLKREVEAVKRSAAEARLSLERLREELSFVQGSVEEFGHDRVALKESRKSVEAATASHGERLTALDGSMKAVEKKTEDAMKALSSFEERLAAIESALEKAAAVRDPEAVYQKGYKETVDKDYDRAIETLGAFLSEFPGHRLAGNAQYWIGEIFYGKGDWERAIIEFDKVIKTHPKGEKAGAATLKQAFAFENLGSKKEARVLLEEVVEKFPKSPEAALARKRLKEMK
jgi:tol-pal system protein YbgF